jgi:hypothetical protein
MWKLEEAIEGFSATALFVVMLPPGSPPAAVSALRAAVDPLNHDAEFNAIQAKTSGPGTVQAAGQTVFETARNFIDMPADEHKLFDDFVKSGEQAEEKKK